MAEHFSARYFSPLIEKNIIPEIYCVNYVESKVNPPSPLFLFAPEKLELLIEYPHGLKISASVFIEKLKKLELNIHKILLDKSFSQEKMFNLFEFITEHYETLSLLPKEDQTAAVLNNFARFSEIIKEIEARPDLLSKLEALKFPMSELLKFSTSLKRQEFYYFCGSVKPDSLFIFNGYPVDLYKQLSAYINNPANPQPRTRLIEIINAEDLSAVSLKWFLFYGAELTDQCLESIISAINPHKNFKIMDDLYNNYRPQLEKLLAAGFSIPTLFTFVESGPNIKRVEQAPRLAHLLIQAKNKDLPELRALQQELTKVEKPGTQPATMLSIPKESALLFTMYLMGFTPRGNSPTDPTSSQQKDPSNPSKRVKFQ